MKKNKKKWKKPRIEEIKTIEDKLVGTWCYKIPSFDPVSLPDCPGRGCGTSGFRAPYS